MTRTLVLHVTLPEAPLPSSRLFRPPELSVCLSFPALGAQAPTGTLEAPDAPALALYLPLVTGLSARYPGLGCGWQRLFFPFQKAVTFGTGTNFLWLSAQALLKESFELALVPSSEQPAHCGR